MSVADKGIGCTFSYSLSLSNATDVRTDATRAPKNSNTAKMYAGVYGGVYGGGLGSAEEDVTSLSSLIVFWLTQLTVLTLIADGVDKSAVLPATDSRSLRMVVSALLSFHVLAIR